MSENLTFFSRKVEIAENASNGNLMAKFCLCDFGVNHKHVQINRETIETWVGSLVNQPLVGRIGYNGDFTGHNMRTATVTNSRGEKETEVVFDTEAIGTFVSVGIEEVDGVECIVGTAEIWRRYPNVCRLIAQRIAEGVLQTSWEILVEESHMDGNTKVIDLGCFTALCVLGRNHPPAYDSSMLLEVAESDDDIELCSAISEDSAQYQAKEEKEMNETIVSEELEVVLPAEDESAIEEEVPESAENSPEAEMPETENADTAEAEEASVDAGEPEAAQEAETEVSALTERDLIEKLEKAIRSRGWDGWVCFLYPEEHTVLVRIWGPDFGELDYMRFIYAVDGETVTVDEGVKVRLEATVLAMNQALAEKNEALAEASQRIRGLEAELSELQPYKEAAEKAEAERLLAEQQEKQEALAQYALSSGFISETEIAENEAIRAMISALDEAGIKQEIAERFMASLRETKPSEIAVSEKTETVAAPELNLEIGEEDSDVSILSVYITQ